jgi:hypothetical protein
MSQIDITAYSSIIIWSWLPFLIIFLFLSTTVIPNFVVNIKILLKLKNIVFYKMFIDLCQIKKINNFIVMLTLKNLIKINKKI